MSLFHNCIKHSSRAVWMFPWLNPSFSKKVSLKHVGYLFQREEKHREASKSNYWGEWAQGYFPAIERMWIIYFLGLSEHLLGIANIFKFSLVLSQFHDPPMHLWHWSHWFCTTTFAVQCSQTFEWYLLDTFHDYQQTWNCCSIYESLWPVPILPQLLIRRSTDTINEHAEGDIVSERHADI